MEKKLIMGIQVIVIFFFIFLGGCLQKQEGLPIVVIGRDNASGTREFFWQYIMGKDNFTENLREKNSNGGIYLSVTQTPGAIGYVGLSYVDSSIKVLKIDNTTANETNILAGKYPIARYLYLLTKGNATGLAKEFIEYIQSSEGQEIVQKEGFVPIFTNIPYDLSKEHMSGYLAISGSTTVFPIVEKAKDSFIRLYPEVQITVSSTGSGPGIAAVSQGTAIIGMSSRDLKTAENNLGLVKYTIAIDGIALIVNLQNTYVENLSLTQLKAIYKGEITNWNELG
jgi:phosphate transport system substrate-binding protein